MSKFDKLLYVLILIGIPASYILNFGWFRLVLSVVFVPYYFAYVAINYFFLKLRVKNSAFDRALFVIGGISYLGANILLRDAGDSGHSYVFFGLIELDDQPSNLMVITVYLFMLQISVSALQVYRMVRFRKQPDRSLFPNGIRLHDGSTQ